MVLTLFLLLSFSYEVVCAWWIYRSRLRWYQVWRKWDVVPEEQAPLEALGWRVVGSAPLEALHRALAAECVVVMACQGGHV